MIIYTVVARGSTVLAEYGACADDVTAKILEILARPHASGTKLVQVGKHLCAIMTKTVGREDFNFAAVIETNDERDNSFNYLDNLAAFFEREQKNPKMTSEMNAFLSRNIKSQMVRLGEQDRANARLGSREKLQGMATSIEKTTQITKSSISRPPSRRRPHGQPGPARRARRARQRPEEQRRRA